MRVSKPCAWIAYKGLVLGGDLAAFSHEVVVVSCELVQHGDGVGDSVEVREGGGRR